MAQATRTHLREDACTYIRPDGEWMDALSGAFVPHVGAGSAIPVERGVRIQGSTAGRYGIYLLGAGAGSPAHSPKRVPAVRGGRRPALVAPAKRQGHSHEILGRSGMAALCRQSLPESVERQVDAR